MTYRYYILPGGDGRNDYGWFNWLKKELENRGHTAMICEEYIMSPAKRAEVFVEKYPVDENTIIIGHSSGGPTAIKWLENISRVIHGLVLVDPGEKNQLLEPWEEDDALRIAFLTSWDWQMDFERARSKIEKCIVLSDENLCAKNKHKKREEGIKEYAEQLGAEYISLKPEKQHFCAEREPSVLDAATRIIC